MKMLVLTNKSGQVIGTYRPNSKEGFGKAGIRPLPGQTLHEIDVPPDVFAIERGEDLHLAVELHLRTAGLIP